MLLKSNNKSYSFTGAILNTTKFIQPNNSINNTTKKSHCYIIRCINTSKTKENIKTTNSESKHAYYFANKSLLFNILFKEDEFKIENKDYNNKEDESFLNDVKKMMSMSSRRILKELSSLPRSIAVLSIIAFFSATGTVIEQGKVK